MLAQIDGLRGSNQRSTTRFDIDSTIAPPTIRLAAIMNRPLLVLPVTSLIQPTMNGLTRLSKAKHFAGSSRSCMHFLCYRKSAIDNPRLVAFRNWVQARLQELPGT